jgi:hypothetical protein
MAALRLTCIGDHELDAAKTAPRQLAQELGPEREEPVTINGDVRELVVTPDKQVFYCFGCKGGGKLVAYCGYSPAQIRSLNSQRSFHL